MTRIFQRLVRYATQSLVLGLMFALPLPAQVPTTAVWHGYLRNSASAPVLNAKVRLTGAASAEASTAPDGAFTLPALPPGKYKLTVEAEGRKVAYAQTIDLTPAAPVELITLSNRGEIEVAEQQQTRHDPASTFPESRSRCWKRWQQPGSR
jgi:hypothetical protein